MSIEIKIRNAMKRYGENTIIPNLSLHIRAGEFFTLLGPSGCGKTTLLRMIAGFNTIEGGEFYFSDRLINDLDPGKRNIGMVFQNYAIFPHLTVRKNVEFGLKNKRFPKEYVKEQTDEILSLIQISEYADRLPERLSGGQQQRVALARALVIRPDVLLMDEPLSNLDAKLRVEMRAVIKNLQRDVGITTVYVTHDQEEAMAVSDRIAVMNAGVIQHLGTPKDIYQRPANLFVATFIGRTNLLNGTLETRGGAPVLTCDGSGYSVPVTNLRDAVPGERKVLISARPEELLLNTDVDAPGIRAVVRDSVFLGLNTHYFVALEGGGSAEIIQESSIASIIPPGTVIRLTINTEKFNLFDENGDENLLEGVNNQYAEACEEAPK